MLSDSEIRELSDQLAMITSPDVRASYLRLVFGLCELPGVSAGPGSHGFIQNEFRGYIGTEWCFSAVLNQSWVLFYFRWPALRDLVLEEAEIIKEFDAERTNAKDVKLRVSRLEDATRIVHFLDQKLKHLAT